MFTPELVNEELGTYVLAANHPLETEKAVELSIGYNAARIRFASNHLPEHIRKCILTYDVRGQHVSPSAISRIEAAFAHIHRLEVLR